MGEILFTTNEVASMLKVDKSTIKRWTDEGKLKCFRTPGGHRKFKADDLYTFMTQFNFGNDLKQTLPKFMSDEIIIRSIIQKKEYNILQSVCFSAAIKGKKEDVIGLFYEVYRAGLSVAMMFDTILMPTIKKINSMFAQSKLTVSEYHLAHNVLSSGVIQLNDSLEKRAKNSKTIVCASIESEKNEIELNALNTLLEIAGYTVLNLGTGMAANTLNQFIIQSKPFAVIIYTSNKKNKEIFSNEIRMIAETAKLNGSHIVLCGTEVKSDSLKHINKLNLWSSFMDFELIQFTSTKEFEKINK